MTQPIIPNEDPNSVEKATGFFAKGFDDFMRQFRLVWRLLLDGRVPTLTKLIPLLAAAYVLSPVDLVPGVVLGFGQLDDLVVFLLGLRLFIDVCPPDLVMELDAESSYTPPTSSEPPSVVIDVEPRVPDNDEESDETSSLKWELPK